MTREEAVMTINFLKEDYKQLLTEEDAEALDMAIEALKQVTVKLNNPDDSLLTADSEACKEQKSKLDLISRAEAIEAVRLKSAKCGLLGRGDILDILSALPPADRPRGEWNEGIFDVGYFCSNCGETSARTSNFYPNCGANMRSGR